MSAPFPIEFNESPNYAMNYASEWNSEELCMLRYLLESNHFDFCRYFLKKRTGDKFIASAHHKLVADTLDRVLLGEITRLIINEPPGYTKTEEAVINFIARGLAINPFSRFLQLSYSDSLALLNSSLVRETVQHPAFQELWPIQLKQDANSKRRWNTEQGGGLYSVSTKGQVTGFRAGRMVPNFAGAMIFDDPLKPEDAFSVEREQVNQSYSSTVKSRVAVESTPIIVIGQRVHENDLSGFLLQGGSGEKWHHLQLPVLIPKKPAKYPKEYTHGIPIEHNLKPGPLWEFKHDREAIELIKKSSPYVYESQYLQEPIASEGIVVKDTWWTYYSDIPKFRVVSIYADTATKKGTHNDYSVFLLAGLYVENREKYLYILDVLRDKWEVPELTIAAKEFWFKHKRSAVRQGASAFKIEDKSSGTGLIQQLERDLKQKIVPIPRESDKVSRMFGGIPHIAAGRVRLPSGPTPYTDAAWVSDFKLEFSKFTPMMSHAYDDQIDPTLDAIEDLLINEGMHLYANV